MSLLATCPDDVSISLNFSDMFWRRVAEDDAFENHVDKTNVYRHEEELDIINVGRAIAVLVFHMIENNGDSLGLLFD